MVICCHATGITWDFTRNGAWGLVGGPFLDKKESFGVGERFCKLKTRFCSPTFIVGASSTRASRLGPSQARSCLFTPHIKPSPVTCHSGSQCLLALAWAGRRKARMGSSSEGRSERRLEHSVTDRPSGTRHRARLPRPMWEQSQV